MPNATLIISDPDGAQWSSELRAELYALLIAEAQRSARLAADDPARARPEDRLTPAGIAVAALEQSILRRTGDDETTDTGDLLGDALRVLRAIRDRASIGVQLSADIGRILVRATTAGHERAHERHAGTEDAWPDWHVRGIVVYRLSKTSPDETAVIDMTVAAPDWHAAETASLDKLRTALEVPEGTPLEYTWASGPEVIHLSEGA
jgi:hypothetical protein